MAPNYAELVSRPYQTKSSDEFMDYEDKINDMFTDFIEMDRVEFNRYLRSDGERGEYLMRRCK